MSTVTSYKQIAKELENLPKQQEYMYSLWYTQVMSYSAGTDNCFQKTLIKGQGDRLKIQH